MTAYALVIWSYTQAGSALRTALLKQEYYQKVGGLRYLSNSLNSILTPIITTAIMGL